MTKTQLGLGMAAIGRPEYINIRTETNIDKTETAFYTNAMQVLDAAYQNGIRYFDTAPSYGKGELFLSDWVKKNPYIDLVLGTKWGYTYVANWQLGFNGAHEIKEHSQTKLKEQWLISQKLFSKIDFYQVHSATFESGILENRDVLNQLTHIQQQTQIGITTTGVDQSEVIKHALEIKLNSKMIFESFQVTYNILEQSTFEVIKEAKQKGKKIIIKEALANGRIFNAKKYPEVYKQLNQLSLKYQVGIDAIALRFVIDSLQPDFVLSGASNVFELNQNVQALHFNLTPTEINQLQHLAINPEVYWQERKALHWN